MKKALFAAALLVTAFAGASSVDAGTHWHDVGSKVASSALTSKETPK